MMFAVAVELLSIFHISLAGLIQQPLSGVLGEQFSHATTKTWEDAASDAPTSMAAHPTTLCSSRSILTVTESGSVSNNLATLSSSSWTRSCIHFWGLRRDEVESTVGSYPLPVY